jgi:hypothetical protein
MKNAEDNVAKFLLMFSIGDYIRFDNPKYENVVKAKIISVDDYEADQPLVEVQFLSGPMANAIRYVLLKEVVKYCVNETRLTEQKIEIWKQLKN